MERLGRGDAGTVADPFAPPPTDVHVEVIGEPDPPVTPRSRLGSVSLPGRRPLTVLAAVLVIAVVIAVVLWKTGPDGPAPITGADVNKAVADGIQKDRQQQRSAPTDATTAYRKILPSLVTITAGSALGTGVVVKADGSVLTALHVVSGGGKIQVQFADGTRSPATVASKQAGNDIAVLAVQQLPQVVVPAVMGGGAQIGDAVYPVGNPLGLQGSLSGGVVSALGRTVRVEGGTTLKNLIQFDAAVNPGNSGGPLLDRDGQVVGIVTGLANPTGQAYFVGIGFAVTIATAGGAAGAPAK